MTQVTHLTLDDEGGLSRKRIHLREISGDSDAPLETVGQDLRAARLRRGDDLATVSRALKIRKDHLEALEEDRFESLPGRAYAVGFVRSYADYLGLDPSQSVERFKGEIAGRVDTQPTVGPPPEPDSMKLPQGWVLIGIVVLVAVLYGAYSLARLADTQLHQPVAPVPASIAPPPPPPTIATQTVHPASAAKPLTAPSVVQPPPQSGLAAQPAGAPASGSQPAAPATAAVPVTSGVTATGPIPTGTPSDGQAAPLPQGTVYGAQNRNARVVIRATGATRILVQAADGTVYLNRMLKPGDSYRVPNRVGLTLTTPDGGAIALELDGQTLGHAGQPAQLTDALALDPQTLVDRFNRHSPG